MLASPTTGVHQIRRQAVGKIHLCILKAETIGCTDPLHCYKGSVHYGNSNCAVNATVLAFEGYPGDIVCTQLGSVNSPFVMNVLTLLNGTGTRSGIVFVAFPCFQKTYANYIETNSDKTFEKGRFTQEFSTITKQVIQGLDTLHENGFCCPNFKGQHVAVMYEGDGPLAKIWNFCLAEICHWMADIPQWIQNINDNRMLPAPPVENGQTFIWGLRCIVEHEDFYIPPKIIAGCNKDEPDLESELRRAWQELFLKVLNLATKMGLKY